MKTRTLLVLILSLITAGLAGGLMEPSGKESVHPDFLVKPQPQPVSEREFHRPTWRRLWTTPADLFFGPLSLEPGENGDLFVADYGDFSIHHLAPSGIPIKRLGNGKGQGPGEFAAITDLEATKDGGLWVADVNNGRLSRFDTAGHPVATLKLERPPYRLIMPDDSSFLLMHSHGSPTLFGLYDRSAREKRSFGEILVNQAKNTLALDGYIESDGRGGFVFAPRYAGLLARYGVDSSLAFLVETVDSKPLPRLLRNEAGATWIDADARPNTWSLSVSGEEIHLLAGIEAGFRKIGVIDTYDRGTGRYLFSRRIPEPCLKAMVIGRYLYTVTDTAVSKWEI